MKSPKLLEIDVDENHGENRFRNENGKNADAVSKLFPVPKITIHVKFTRIRLSAL